MNAHWELSPRKLARWRQLAGMAGVATAAMVMASIVVLFGEASSAPWLAPTPENLARMQRCERLIGSAAHQECVDSVIAATLKGDRRLQLAISDPASGKAMQSH